ncbi:MAG: hypothetical protein GF411_20130 [Candidatus Lokiarchaeota archaeon]|nr:hypothetical protein [Candidatus Lokiarchaeota archaeon]
MATGANEEYLVIIKQSQLWKELDAKKSSDLEKYEVKDKSKIAKIQGESEVTIQQYREKGIPETACLVPFVRKTTTKYYTKSEWYIDWSCKSVKKLKDSDGARFQNERLYFKKGFVTDAHHGILSAALIEYSIPAVNTNLFFGTDIETELIVGFLNSSLASYFLGKVINTSLGGMSGHATPEDIRRIPIRLPLSKIAKEEFKEIKNSIISKVNEIVKQLKKNSAADITIIQQDIDDLVFKWFDLSDDDISLVKRYIEQKGDEKEEY